MTDHSSKIWLAYLTAEVVDQCTNICISECPACQNRMFSPLLHYHEELNLKQKIERYLGRVIIDIANLFDQFIMQFGWFSLDRTQYIQFGEIFLSVTTADAIYYGKYITPQNDFTIYGNQTAIIENNEENESKPTPPSSLKLDNNNKRQAPPEKKLIKSKQRKKDVSSQNAVSRSGV